MSDGAAGARGRALGAACTAHAVQDGLMAATYVLLPLLAQTFGFGYAQVGLFKGLKSLVQAALEMSSGVLSERTGEARALILGLAVSGPGFAALAAADEAGLILACLLFVGAGAAFQHAPASALVSAAFAGHGRRGALGLYNSAGDVGKLAFAGGISLAVAVGLSWQQVALSYGGLTLLAALGIALVLRTGASASASRVAPKTRTEAPATVSVWGILHRHAFATLLLVVTLDNLVQAGVLVFVAFLMLEKGLSLPVATMASVMVLAGGVFGKAGCGYLAQRMGVRRAFALVQCLTAAALVAVVAAPHALAFALLVPLGVVCQGSTTITYGMVPDLIHPRRLARGYALMYSTTSLAAAAGPFAFGVLADAAGIEQAILAMAVVAVLSMLPTAAFAAMKPAA